LIAVHSNMDLRLDRIEVTQLI